MLKRYTNYSLYAYHMNYFYSILFFEVEVSNGNAGHNKIH